MKEYSKIMQYIAKINQITNRVIFMQETPEDLKYIRSGAVSSIAWEISAKLFCEDEATKQRVLDVLTNH